MWLNAAEVAFCRAEGGLLGWKLGDGGSIADPETFYKQGIQLSFEQWNASGAADYMDDATSVPDKYVDPAGKHRTMAAPSAMTVKWNNSASDDEKLERIMIQKWIALFPNGQEAWTEWRRTGYPKLNPVMANRGSSQGVTTEGGIRRMVYPISFYQTADGQVIYNDAVKMLSNGQDLPSTHLWWDC